MSLTASGIDSFLTPGRVYFCQEAVRPSFLVAVAFLLTATFLLVAAFVVAVAFLAVVAFLVAVSFGVFFLALGDAAGFAAASSLGAV